MHAKIWKPNVKKAGKEYWRVSESISFSVYEARDLISKSILPACIT
jgi:hypothetical protein